MFSVLDVLRRHEEGLPELFENIDLKNKSLVCVYQSFGNNRHTYYFHRDADYSIYADGD